MKHFFLVELSKSRGQMSYFFFFFFIYINVTVSIGFLKVSWGCGGRKFEILPELFFNFQKTCAKGFLM